MTEQYQQFMENLQAQLDQEQLRRQKAEVQNAQISMGSEVNNQDIVKWQLDISAEKEEIYYFLKSYVIEIVEGVERWVPPRDINQKIFTEYAVDKLMSMLNNWVTKNNYLSFYEPDTIRQKMRELSRDIADFIYYQYEFIFYLPDIKDLIARDKIKFKWTEDQVQEYMQNDKFIDYYENMSVNIFNRNKSYFPMIWRMMIDAIHAAYQRAMYGEERSSLRKVMHVSQSMNNYGGGNQPVQMPQNDRRKFNIFNPTTWRA